MPGFVGNVGERIAEFALVDKGMRVLERNFSCRFGEIDLICEDGDVLVFVEVKCRISPRFGSPLEAITPTKQRRICKTALYYLKIHGWLERRARFDAVAVTPDGVKYVRSAFDYRA